MISTNELFRKNIKFVQYGRSGSVLITSSQKIANELCKKGWNLYKTNKTFRLNPPSINLVDISDISKINQYYNPLFNYALYKYLKKKLEKNNLNIFIDKVISEHKLLFKNFDYHVSVGPILNFAIKIEGSDNQIYKLQRLIIETILNDEQFQKIQKEIISTSPNNCLSQKAPLKEDNIEIYNKMCLNFKQNMSLKLGDFVYLIDTGIIDFNNYDVVLLILNGCFKFLQYFNIKSFVNKIVFWEIHIDKNKGEDKILDTEILKNKRILVIDSIYSGATINYIKNLLCSISNSVDVLGIFPKSEGIFNLCDYVLVGNKIFRSDDLKKYSFVQDYLTLLGDKSNEKRHTS